MEEYRIGCAIVRIHGKEPENMKEATERFMKKVIRHRKKAKSKGESMDKKFCEAISLSGAVLRDARTKEGYTQEEAAELLGVSRKTVINWENGTHFPKGKKLKAVMGLYHLNSTDK